MSTGPLVLDTNIVVHLLRGKSQAAAIQAAVDLTSSPNLTSRVVVGECLSLARRLAWGAPRMERMRSLLGRLIVVEISSEAVLDKDAEFDELALDSGRKMGNNDLWIAACTAAVGGVLVTGDDDFNVLVMAGKLSWVHILDAAMKEDAQ